jgi:hypothetical protein
VPSGVVATGAGAGPRSPRRLRHNDTDVHQVVKTHSFGLRGLTAWGLALKRERCYRSRGLTGGDHRRCVSGWRLDGGRLEFHGGRL